MTTAFDQPMTDKHFDRAAYMGTKPGGNQFKPTIDGFGFSNEQGFNKDGKWIKTEDKKKNRDGPAPELGDFKGEPGKVPMKLPFVRDKDQEEVEIKFVKSATDVPLPKLMRKTTSMDSQK